MSTIERESSANSDSNNNKNKRMLPLPNELLSEAAQFVPAGACMVDGFADKMSRVWPLSTYVRPRYRAFSKLKRNAGRHLRLEGKMLRLKAEIYDLKLKLIDFELTNISAEDPVDFDKFQALAQRANELREKGRLFKEASLAFLAKTDAFVLAWKSSHKFAEQLVNGDGDGAVEKIGEEDEEEAFGIGIEESKTAGADEAGTSTTAANDNNDKDTTICKAKKRKRSSTVTTGSEEAEEEETKSKKAKTN